MIIYIMIIYIEIIYIRIIDIRLPGRVPGSFDSLIHFRRLCRKLIRSAPQFFF